MTHIFSVNDNFLVSELCPFDWECDVDYLINFWPNSVEFRCS